MFAVKSLKIFLIVAGVSATIYIIAINFLGSGIKDQEIKLINGYSYWDAGHHEKQILYVENDNPPKVVIDSRVDNYFIKDDTIFIARRPREIFKDDDIVKTRISNKCEYWYIDTSRNIIKKVESFPSLNCR